MKAMKVGIIGCGNISNIYIQSGSRFESIEIAACADAIRSRATSKAKEHGIPRSLTVKQLLADRSIDIVLDLTVPKAHGEIALAAITAGKHVHNEKPLALTRKEGKAILAAAKKKKVRVGCAPDTVLGAGIQTARKIIDDGWIGEPVSATAFMQCHGHESWHPDPEFYYEAGGGPMFDMGPYYLSALVTLMGPVARVTGATSITFPERRITSQPKNGKVITVQVPTHVAGVMEFASGAICTMVTSFDVWSHTLPPIEIHGTAGSLSVPDPNSFGGPVKVWRPGSEGWAEMPLSHPYASQSRGIGVADMACAIQSGRAHRANGTMGYHVLDIMHAFHDAADQKKHIELESTCERPAAMPMDVLDGTLDA